jgi:hypothetical protein
VAVGILIVAVVGLFLGFLVLQAVFAARHWQRVIAEGDADALGEAIDNAFEGWRSQRPPKGMAPADWRALSTAALVAADRDRARVSLLADAEVRVIGSRRVEMSSAQDVARRVAVTMAERLFYEIPHVHFEQVQVDVLTDYRARDGEATVEPLLSTRPTRDQAAEAEWDLGEPADLLAEWDTREVLNDASIDLDADAVITAGEPAADGRSDVRDAGAA